MRFCSITSLRLMLHHHPPLRQATHTTSPEGKSVHGHLPIHVAAIPSAKHPPGMGAFWSPRKPSEGPFSSTSRGPGLTQDICDLHWIGQFCTGGTGGLAGKRDAPTRARYGPFGQKQLSKRRHLFLTWALCSKTLAASADFWWEIMGFVLALHFRLYMINT